MRIGLPLSFVLVAAGLAGAWFGSPLPAVRPLPGAGTRPAGKAMPGGGSPGPPVPTNYGPIAPPHPSRAAVVELLEDDAGRLARALNAGEAWAGITAAGAWAGDKFSGATCLKVVG